jgi:L-iditol 2-dehydrogenase
MKAAMYYSNRDVRLEEMPRPRIGRGELLVRVMASGICGSDVMEWYRIKTAPRVLGHEVAGEVAEAGEGMAFRKGDRVFVSHHVPCNTCRHCLRGHHTTCDTLRKTNFHPGGFAEYIRVPRINVEKGTFLLPGGVSFEQGTFIEPLACAARAQRLAGTRPGDTILVLGSGISGLLHIRLALALGAGRVFATDISDYRLGMARKSGALTIRADGDVPSKLKALNDGRLADRVIVCTGAEPAARQALVSAERGGVIMFFAVPRPGVDVPVPLNDFWKNEIRVMTSYAAAPDDIKKSIELIGSGRIHVEDMITHRLPLERAGEGFGLVASAGESIKVIIQPHGG